MIRFIDIRGQGTGRRFAFFDTITNHFLTTESGHAWNEKEDIENEPTFSQEMKDRLISLLPGWAHYDEDGDPKTLPEKEHKPDTKSWTWERILGRINRYGGSPDDRLFELLDDITDINDDMAHNRFNPEAIRRTQIALDGVRGSVFEEFSIEDKSPKYREILSELDRYGGLPNHTLFPILEILSDINTDINHGGTGYDTLSGLYKAADLLSEQLLDGGGVLSPFDARVLAFFNLLSMSPDDPNHDKTIRQLLGTTDEALSKSTEKLLRLGMLAPDGIVKKH